MVKTMVVSKRDDIVAGAMHTYVKNGLKNGGFICPPICKPMVAWKSWDASTGHEGSPGKVSTMNWPCDAVKGLFKCGEYEFDDGSINDDSPSVTDGKQIIRNTQGDTTTDWTRDVRSPWTSSRSLPGTMPGSARSLPVVT